MLGTTDDSEFTIDPAVRLQHTGIFGGTGVGKTTFLLNLILDDIRTGQGVGFIDPHGQAAEDLLWRIPKTRREDVIYFSPADLAHPVGWNVLQKVHKDRQHTVAENVVDALKSIWHDAWGQRMERLLYHGCRVQLALPDGSMLGLWRMYRDEAYRLACLEHVTDPLVNTFWRGEFHSWNKNAQAEAVMPILNRLDQFLGAPGIRNILGQPKSTFALADILEGQKIFIANLAQGEVGPNTAHLLGSLLVSQFWTTALHRSDAERVTPFFLHLDEYALFKTATFAHILSEARKYGLGLTLVGQYLNQAPEMVDPILNNVHTLAAFRMSADDATRLTPNFGYRKQIYQEAEDHFINAPYNALDLVQLPPYTATIKHGNEISTVACHPLSGTRWNPKPILAENRSLYGRPRAKVERQLATFLAKTFRQG